MKKNLIFIPFAHDPEANSGVNLHATRNERLDVYFKNICVALCSARHHNPNCEVALVTNLKNADIPSAYKDLLEKHEISIFYVPFDSFRFPDDYKWSLAFYKLCALKHISGKDFSNVCYLDTDVWIQGSFDPIWKESEQKILLYDINHGLNVKAYRSICDEFSAFSGEKCFLTHFGGEFFAGSKHDSTLFINEAEKIFFEIQEKQLQIKTGDEFILSLTAERFHGKIKNAGAYIFRFWTSFFYLVSTCYQYNSVIVLHVPAEKERGMIKLYNKYIRFGKIPSDRQAHRILHLTSRSLRTIIGQFIFRMMPFLKK